MHRRHVAALIVIVTAACSSASPQPSSKTGTVPGRATTSTVVNIRKTPIRQATLDLIANRYRSSCKSPGAAIGVRTNDGVARFALSGRLVPGVPIRRDSQFLAGSVTKLFVATVAYQLIAQHELSLDAPVDRYLPGWPRGDRITVGMLLGHRSGMGDFGNDFSAQLRDLVLSDLRRVFRYDEILDLIRDIPPVADPGTSYHYTNANYIVLGAILQRITKETLGHSMETRIIEPLGLGRTIYGPDDLAAADAVVFHGLFDITGTGTPLDIGGFPRAAALTVDPAGAGLFSTLPDLLTVTHALFAGDDLVAVPQRNALEGSVSTLAARDLLLDDRFVIHGHGGASPGAQTIVVYDTIHDTTVAVWCNLLDPGNAELLPSVIAAKETLELAAES